MSEVIPVNCPEHGEWDDEFRTHPDGEGGQCSKQEPIYPNEQPQVDSNLPEPSV